MLMHTKIELAAYDDGNRILHKLPRAPNDCERPHTSFNLIFNYKRYYLCIAEYVLFFQK